MAMCKEGGKGAHIEYISPADNRGAGSWVGNKLDKYPDGTRVKFDVSSSCIFHNEGEGNDGVNNFVFAINVDEL